MSPAPFARSADLKQLREDGYLVQIKGNLLVLREVPYLNAKQELKRGTLVSTLNLAGDQTQAPETHVIHWIGEFPCSVDGRPIEALRHQDSPTNLGHGLVVNHGFSNKPEGDYRDYHHKMTTYIAVISGPATTVSPGVTARGNAVPEEEEASVFNYTDTATGRAGLGALAEKLAQETVAIIGVGGTGGYILDQVAKTPAPEIRLFDSDEFMSHNAFRAPGAASLEELRELPFKVDYWTQVYSRMRKGIVPHPVAIDATNAHLLDGVTFAFICIDDGPSKKAVIDKLEAIDASFIDVGMGLQLDDGSLGGILRITASTPAKRDHIHAGRIDFSDDKGEDLYATNIQVADLNALNAAMAVIKWKKLRGFYRDLEGEHHSTYTTDGNLLLNGDQ